ncbi:MAG: tripartite tricarboxylate transporter substrate binding protein [Desulfovibrionaceae bacterium]|nr:tripartite tricarboxylate transporter substrate binding protein [Desulfovibrionaceae bacterium]
MNIVKLFLILGTLFLPLQAFGWQPTESVSVIVAYKAGSGTDSSARVLLHFAEKYVGQKLIVKNVPGEEGKLGWTELSRAKPDGKTIGFISLPTFTILSAMPDASFSINGIVPIANHISETSVIVVKSKSPYRTLQDLVQACKKNPDTITCSTNGFKSSNHVAVQLFAKTADIRYKALSCDGTANQLAALRADRAVFSCAKICDVARFCAGPRPEFRMLAVFSPKRLADFPWVPTLGELGYYPKWYGSARAIVAPEGTPEEIIAFYEDAFRRAMDDPDCQKAHRRARMTIEFLNKKELADRIFEQLVFARDTVPAIFAE